MEGNRPGNLLSSFTPPIPNKSNIHEDSKISNFPCSLSVIVEVTLFQPSFTFFASTSKFIMQARRMTHKC